MVLGVVIAAETGGTSATLTSYTYAGAYAGTTTLQHGQITIAPPPADTSNFSATPGQVFASFQSTSPAASVAAELGYGPATVFQATFTNLGMGAVDPATNAITPEYSAFPAWILMYRNVHWPTSPAGPGKLPNIAAAPAPATGAGLSGLEDVIVVFAPNGQCVDTLVTPAA